MEINNFHSIQHFVVKGQSHIDSSHAERHMDANSWVGVFLTPKELNLKYCFFQK